MNYRIFFFIFIIGLCIPNHTNVYAQKNTDKFCFSAGNDAIATCSNSDYDCKSNLHAFQAKTGDRSLKCIRVSTAPNPYPRYCIGIKDMTSDVCFSTQSGCQNIYNKLNKYDSKSFPLFDISNQNATQCIKQESPQSSVSLVNPLNGIDNIFQLVDRIVTILVKILLPIAFAILVWTGFRFVAAQGNSEKLAGAKKTLKLVIIGLIIILSAKMLTKILASTVFQILGK